MVDLKKKFGRGDNETIKVAELKKIKQGNKIMEKFMQEFRRVARKSRYEERLLIEEFERNEWNNQKKAYGGKKTERLRR